MYSIHISSRQQSRVIIQRLASAYFESLRIRYDGKARRLIRVEGASSSTEFESKAREEWQTGQLEVLGANFV